MATKETRNGNQRLHNYLGGSDNSIGVLGELAADLGTAAFRVHRARERHELLCRYEAVATDSSGDDAWRSDLASEAAKAEEAVNASLLRLYEYLETAGYEFLKFCMNAKSPSETFCAQVTFDLVHEWAAIRELTIRLLSAALPTFDKVVVLVGRLEILIERIQSFFKRAALEPDHFRA